MIGSELFGPGGRWWNEQSNYESSLLYHTNRSNKIYREIQTIKGCDWQNWEVDQDKRRAIMFQYVRKS